MEFFDYDASLMNASLGQMNDALAENAWSAENIESFNIMETIQSQSSSHCYSRSDTNPPSITAGPVLGLSDIFTVFSRQPLPSPELKQSLLSPKLLDDCFEIGVTETITDCGTTPDIAHVQQSAEASLLITEATIDEATNTPTSSENISTTVQTALSTGSVANSPADHGFSHEVALNTASVETLAIEGSAENSAAVEVEEQVLDSEEFAFNKLEAMCPRCKLSESHQASPAIARSTPPLDTPADVKPTRDATETKEAIQLSEVANQLPLATFTSLKNNGENTSNPRTTGLRLGGAKDSLDDPCRDTNSDFRGSSSLPHDKSQARTVSTTSRSITIGSSVDQPIVIDDELNNEAQHARHSSLHSVSTISTTRSRDKPQRPDGMIMWSEPTVEQRYLRDNNIMFEKLQTAWLDVQQLPKLSGIPVVESYSRELEGLVARSIEEETITHDDVLDLIVKYKPIIHAANALLKGHGEKKAIRNFRRILSQLRDSSHVVGLITDHPMEDDDKNDVTYRHGRSDADRSVKRRRQ